MVTITAAKVEKTAIPRMIKNESAYVIFPVAAVTTPRHRPCSRSHLYRCLCLHLCLRTCLGPLRGGRNDTLQPKLKVRQSAFTGRQLAVREVCFDSASSMTPVSLLPKKVLTKMFFFDAKMSSNTGLRKERFEKGFV
ncbi:hypothetical protein EVAR_72567_1 [Eumeta japonica]|uniref:Uncharacterized protein n=1 Tax=Eumeta variegata TaxID=151549 RepID=A0A4C1SXG1_EUMVA|nr:hypothetical protein EVAR_72567_1 [Eumeta japonica]